MQSYGASSKANYGLGWMKGAESKHISVQNACGLGEVVFSFPLMVKIYYVMRPSHARKYREETIPIF